MNYTQPIVLLVAAAISFAVAAILGRKVIPLLHKLKFGQTILDIGPSWHKQKQGTPTMGGVLFIAGMGAALLIMLVFCGTVLKLNIFAEPVATQVRLWAGLLLTLGCGAIGFIDDYIKIRKKRNLGLTDKQKLFLQLVLSLGYGLLLFFGGEGARTCAVPFAGDVDFGFWVVPLAMLVIIGASNATNLTDGVDGLCATNTVFAAAAFLAVSGLEGTFYQSLYTAALIGGLMGFLLYNLHPAKVFMGDTGSLFIGGALCAVAFGIGHPLLLIPFGVVYIMETLSVILQVGYFKLTHGKRLFRMSPIHHHFEMGGWSENRIVLTFSGITIVVAFVTVLLLILC